MEANGSARSASGWSIIMGDLVSCFIARQCCNRNTVFLVMLGPVLGECGSDGSFFGGVIVAASVLSKTNINIIYPILSILFNSVISVISVISYHYLSLSFPYDSDLRLHVQPSPSRWCPVKDLSDLETVPVDSRDQVAHRRGVIAALYEDGLLSLLRLLRCVPML